MLMLIPKQLLSKEKSLFTKRRNTWVFDAMRRPCLELLDCVVDKHLRPLAKGVFGDENNVKSNIHKLGISKENRVRESSNLMPATVITIAFHGGWLRVQAAARRVVMANVTILHK